MSFTIVPGQQTQIESDRLTYLSELLGRVACELMIVGDDDLSKLPKKLAKRFRKLAYKTRALCMDVDTFAEESRHGKEITWPAAKPLQIEDLVKGITRKNRHGEIGTGAPVGDEII